MRNKVMMNQLILFHKTNKKKLAVKQINEASKFVKGKEKKPHARQLVV
jgi:hypothetical protein